SSAANPRGVVAGRPVVAGARFSLAADAKDWSPLWVARCGIAVPAAVVHSGARATRSRSILALCREQLWKRGGAVRLSVLPRAANVAWAADIDLVRGLRGAVSRARGVRGARVDRSCRAASGVGGAGGRLAGARAVGRAGRGSIEPDARCDVAHHD